jgi:hypothetical protein
MKDGKRRNLTELRSKAKAEFGQKNWVKDLERRTGKPITKGASSSRVDFIFAVDTTGSMSGKIDGLLATCMFFAEECRTHAMSPEFTLIAFGDLNVPGDEIVTTVRAGDIDTFKRGLKAIPRFSGGGNEGESSLDAAVHAAKVECRPGAVKIIVLITDEPPLQHGNVTGPAVIRELIRGQFVAYVVSPPGILFQDMAKRTGGGWYEIGDHLDLSDILSKFRRLALQASALASDIHKLAGGSVAEYLRLAPPEK